MLFERNFQQLLFNLLNNVLFSSAGKGIGLKVVSKTLI